MTRVKLIEMTFLLTDDQQRQIASAGDQPAEVMDPRTQRRFVLVPVEEYEAMRDERERIAWGADSARTLGQRLAEGE